MNSLFCTLVVAISLSGAQIAEWDKSMGGLRIQILGVDKQGNVSVEIRNGTRGPIRIWKESNSWGAANWRILVMRSGKIDTFFQNPNQAFTRNIPAFIEIPAEGHIEQKLDLNGGNWCGFGHCGGYNDKGFADKKATFETNDTVIVIYDVRRSNESGKYRVWYGVVAASKTVQ